MAKRASRKTRAGEAAAPNANPREAAVDALMALLAETPYGEIGLGDVAKKAGLSLADLRAAVRGKFAILMAFSERIDRAVLDGGAAEGEGERDRLFDVLMRRFDALSPYRAALLSLTRSAQRDPALAAAVACNAERSMKWMLAAAGIENSGIVGRIAASGAGFAFAEAMRTWLREDDPNNEKAMGALDRALRRGERAMGYLRDARDFLASFGMRSRGKDSGEAETTA